MKQSEMYVGMRVVVGRDQGRNGIAMPNMRSPVTVYRVEQLGVPGSVYSRRNNAVELQQLDDEGNPAKFSGDWIERRYPEKIGKVIPPVRKPAKVLISLVDYEAERAGCEQAEQERVRRQERKWEHDNALLEMFAQCGISEEEVNIVSGFDENDDVVLRRLNFTADGSATIVAVIRGYLAERKDGEMWV